MKKAPLGKAGRDVDSITIREGRALTPPAQTLSNHDRNVGLADFRTLNHPHPVGVSKVPNGTGINVPSGVLWKLLHLQRAKAVVQKAGRYPGKRHAINIAELERHLRGEITLAFSALSGG